MTREEHYGHFPESFQTVSEVAQAYFPGYVLPSSAIRRFRKELEHDEELLACLEGTGYKLENLQLSPKQICILYNRWGVPGKSSCFFKPDFEQ